MSSRSHLIDPNHHSHHYSTHHGHHHGHGHGHHQGSTGSSTPNHHMSSSPYYDGVGVGGVHHQFGSGRVGVGQNNNPVSEYPNYSSPGGGMVVPSGAPIFNALDAQKRLLLNSCLKSAAADMGNPTIWNDLVMSGANSFVGGGGATPGSVGSLDGPYGNAEVEELMDRMNVVVPNHRVGTAPGTPNNVIQNHSTYGTPPNGTPTPGDMPRSQSSVGFYYGGIGINNNGSGTPIHSGSGGNGDQTSAPNSVLSVHQYSSVSSPYGQHCGPHSIHSSTSSSSSSMTPPSGGGGKSASTPQLQRPNQTSTPGNGTPIGGSGFPKYSDSIASSPVMSPLSVGGTPNNNPGSLPPLSAPVRCHSNSSAAASNPNTPYTPNGPHTPGCSATGPMTPTPMTPMTPQAANGPHTPMGVPNCGGNPRTPVHLKREDTASSCGSPFPSNSSDYQNLFSNGKRFAPVGSPASSVVSLKRSPSVEPASPYSGRMGTLGGGHPVPSPASSLVNHRNGVCPSPAMPIGGPGTPYGGGGGASQLGGTPNSAAYLGNANPGSNLSTSTTSYMTPYHQPQYPSSVASASYGMDSSTYGSEADLEESDLFDDAMEEELLAGYGGLKASGLLGLGGGSGSSQQRYVGPPLYNIGVNNIALLQTQLRMFEEDSAKEVEEKRQRKLRMADATQRMLAITSSVGPPSSFGPHSSGSSSYGSGGSYDLGSSVDLDSIKMLSPSQMAATAASQQQQQSQHPSLSTNHQSFSPLSTDCKYPPPSMSGHEYSYQESSSPLPDVNNFDLYTNTTSVITSSSSSQFQQSQYKDSFLNEASSLLTLGGSGHVLSNGLSSGNSASSNSVPNSYVLNDMSPMSSVAAAFSSSSQLLPTFSNSFTSKSVTGSVSSSSAALRTALRASDFVEYGSPSVGSGGSAKYHHHHHHHHHQYPSHHQLAAHFPNGINDNILANLSPAALARATQGNPVDTVTFDPKTGMYKVKKKRGRPRKNPLAPPTPSRSNSFGSGVGNGCGNGPYGSKSPGAFSSSSSISLLSSSSPYGGGLAGPAGVGLARFNSFNSSIEDNSSFDDPFKPHDSDPYAFPSYLDGPMSGPVTGILGSVSPPPPLNSCANTITTSQPQQQSAIGNLLSSSSPMAADHVIAATTTTTTAASVSVPTAAPTTPISCSPSSSPTSPPSSCSSTPSSLPPLVSRTQSSQSIFSTTSLSSSTSSLASLAMPTAPVGGEGGTSAPSGTNHSNTTTTSAPSHGSSIRKTLQHQLSTGSNASSLDGHSHGHGGQAQKRGRGRPRIHDSSKPTPTIRMSKTPNLSNIPSIASLITSLPGAPVMKRGRGRPKSLKTLLKEAEAAVALAHRNGEEVPEELRIFIEEGKKAMAAARITQAVGPGGAASGGLPSSATLEANPPLSLQQQHQMANMNRAAYASMVMSGGAPLSPPTTTPLQQRFQQEFASQLSVVAGGGGGGVNGPSNTSAANQRPAISALNELLARNNASYNAANNNRTGANSLVNSSSANIAPTNAVYNKPMPPLHAAGSSSMVQSSSKVPGSRIRNLTDSSSEFDTSDEKDSSSDEDESTTTSTDAEQKKKPKVCSQPAHHQVRCTTTTTTALPVLKTSTLATTNSTITTMAPISSLSSANSYTNNLSAHNATAANLKPLDPISTLTHMPPLKSPSSPGFPLPAPPSVMKKKSSLPPLPIAPHLLKLKQKNQQLNHKKVKGQKGKESSSEEEETSDDESTYSVSDDDEEEEDTSSTSDDEVDDDEDDDDDDEDGLMHDDSLSNTFSSKATSRKNQSGPHGHRGGPNQQQQQRSGSNGSGSKSGGTSGTTPPSGKGNSSSSSGGTPNKSSTSIGTRGYAANGGGMTMASSGRRNSKSSPPIGLHHPRKPISSNQNQPRTRQRYGLTGKPKTFSEGFHFMNNESDDEDDEDDEDEEEEEQLKKKSRDKKKKIESDRRRKSKDHQPPPPPLPKLVLKLNSSSSGATTSSTTTTFSTAPVVEAIAASATTSTLKQQSVSDTYQIKPELVAIDASNNAPQLQQQTNRKMYQSAQAICTSPSPLPCSGNVQNPSLRIRIKMNKEASSSFVCSQVHEVSLDEEDDIPDLIEFCSGDYIDRIVKDVVTYLVDQTVRQVEGCSVEGIDLDSENRLLDGSLELQDSVPLQESITCNVPPTNTEDDTASLAVRNLIEFTSSRDLGHSSQQYNSFRSPSLMMNPNHHQSLHHHHQSPGHAYFHPNGTSAPNALFDVSSDEQSSAINSIIGDFGPGSHGAGAGGGSGNPEDFLGLDSHLPARHRLDSGPMLDNSGICVVDGGREIRFVQQPEVVQFAGEMAEANLAAAKANQVFLEQSAVQEEDAKASRVAKTPVLTTTIEQVLDDDDADLEEVEQVVSEDLILDQIISHQPTTLNTLMDEEALVKDLEYASSSMQPPPIVLPQQQPIPPPPQMIHQIPPMIQPPVDITPDMALLNEMISAEASAEDFNVISQSMDDNMFDSLAFDQFGPLPQLAQDGLKQLATNLSSQFNGSLNSITNQSHLIRPELGNQLNYHQHQHQQQSQVFSQQSFLSPLPPQQSQSGLIRPSPNTNVLSSMFESRASMALPSQPQQQYPFYSPMSNFSSGPIRSSVLDSYQQQAQLQQHHQPTFGGTIPQPPIPSNILPPSGGAAIFGPGSSGIRPQVLVHQNQQMMLPPSQTSQHLNLLSQLNPTSSFTPIPLQSQQHYQSPLRHAHSIGGLPPPQLGSGPPLQQALQQQQFGLLHQTQTRHSRSSSFRSLTPLSSGAMNSPNTPIPGAAFLEKSSFPPAIRPQSSNAKSNATPNLSQLLASINPTTPPPPPIVPTPVPKPFPELPPLPLPPLVPSSPSSSFVGNSSSLKKIFLEAKQPTMIRDKLDTKGLNSSFPFNNSETLPDVVASNRNRNSTGTNLPPVTPSIMNRRGGSATLMDILNETMDEADPPPLNGFNQHTNTRRMSSSFVQQQLSNNEVQMMSMMSGHALAHQVMATSTLSLDTGSTTDDLDELLNSETDVVKLEEAIRELEQLDSAGVPNPAAVALNSTLPRTIARKSNSAFMTIGETTSADQLLGSLVEKNFRLSEHVSTGTTSLFEPTTLSPVMANAFSQGLLLQPDASTFEQQLPEFESFDNFDHLLNLEPTPTLPPLPPVQQSAQQQQIEVISLDEDEDDLLSSLSDNNNIVPLKTVSLDNQNNETLLFDQNETECDDAQRLLQDMVTKVEVVETEWSSNRKVTELQEQRRKSIEQQQQEQLVQFNEEHESIQSLIDSLLEKVELDFQKVHKSSQDLLERNLPADKQICVELLNNIVELAAKSEPVLSPVDNIIAMNKEEESSMTDLDELTKLEDKQTDEEVCRLFEKSTPACKRRRSLEVYVLSSSTTSSEDYHLEPKRLRSNSFKATSSASRASAESPRLVSPDRSTKSPMITTSCTTSNSHHGDCCCGSSNSSKKSKTTSITIESSNNRGFKRRIIDYDDEEEEEEDIGEYEDMEVMKIQRPKKETLTEESSTNHVFRGRSRSLVIRSTTSEGHSSTTEILDFHAPTSYTTSTRKSTRKTLKCSSPKAKTSAKSNASEQESKTNDTTTLVESSLSSEPQVAQPTESSVQHPDISSSVEETCKQDRTFLCRKCCCHVEDEDEDDEVIILEDDEEVELLSPEPQKSIHKKNRHDRHHCHRTSQPQSHYRLRSSTTTTTTATSESTESTLLTEKTGPGPVLPPPVTIHHHYPTNSATGLPTVSINNAFNSTEIVVNHSAENATTIIHINAGGGSATSANNTSTAKTTSSEASTN